MEGQNKLRVMISKFFQNLYFSDHLEGINDVLEHISPRVTLVINDTVGASMTDKEINVDIFNLGSLESLSSDGFLGIFFQKY